MELGSTGYIIITLWWAAQLVSATLANNRPECLLDSTNSISITIDTYNYL